MGFKIASSGDCQNSQFWCTSNFGTRLGGSLAPKIGFGKRGLFRKVHFPEILGNLEILEILQNPHAVENKGESDHFLEILEILENLELLEILEIPPAWWPLSPVPTTGYQNRCFQNGKFWGLSRLASGKTHCDLALARENCCYSLTLQSSLLFVFLSFCVLGVALANQTKERSVHERFAGAFRNKSSMWIVLVFLRKKHQNSQKWAKFMNFSFWPFLWFGLPGRLLIFAQTRIWRAWQVGKSLPFWGFPASLAKSKNRRVRVDSEAKENPSCGGHRQFRNSLQELLLETWFFRFAHVARCQSLGVSRWGPFLKSIRVFSVVGLAVNSD